MNKRDQEALDKQLENPEFEALYWELMTLQARCFPDVPVVALPTTAEKLKKGKPPRMVVAKTRVPFKVTKARVRVLIREAHHLASQLAAFFPERRRWRWQQIFLIKSLRGEGTIEGERLGGPVPTPQGKKLEIVKRWLEVQGRTNQEVYAAGKGISARQLRRWMRDLKDEGML